MTARWAALCLAVLASPPAALGQANPIQVENARPATPGWAAVDETTSIEGYADRTSVAPGETIGFHVVAHEAGARYRIQIFRLGWYGGGGARLVACLPGCDADRAAAFPPPPPVSLPTGELRAGWPRTDGLGIPDDWVSGYHEARIVLTAGDRKSVV